LVYRSNARESISLDDLVSLRIEEESRNREKKPLSVKFEPKLNIIEQKSKLQRKLK